jgi:hypothetical protein
MKDSAYRDVLPPGGVMSARLECSGLPMKSILVQICVVTIGRQRHSPARVCLEEALPPALAPAGMFSKPFVVMTEHALSAAVRGRR